MGTQKSKRLYINTGNDIELTVKCWYNLNTNSIGIYTHFIKYKSRKRPINKNSSQFLGVHIAEKVLSKVFKNVKIMPPNNKGYDIICSEGYLIDIKSATINDSNGWMFYINKNTIADYFLCLAFDNRTDLNPVHLWLIPSAHINHLQCTGINPNTLNRWSDYELIEKNNDVIQCCDMLKKKEMIKKCK